MREPTLDDLRKALLRGLRTTRPLPVDDSDLAFERHQLLAARFVRVARLDRPPGAKTREGWHSLFRDHFPRGDDHARLLWAEWRKPLLQRGTPGTRVTITHGQPGAHWRLHDGVHGVAIVVDLESMWADFASTVESFVDACAAERSRARRALRRWRASTWTAQQLARPGEDGKVYSLDPMLGSTSTATTWQNVVYSLRAS